MDDGNGGLKLCSNIIKTSDLENNPNILGEYNVAKYVDAFNKRAKALLEGFEPKIRKDILRTDPTQCEQFSPSELELKSFPADDLEEAMVLEDQELEFWNRSGLRPDKIWDGYKLPTPDALDEIDEYEDKVRQLNEKLKRANDPRVVKTVNEEVNENDFVLHKNFNIFDLYHKKDNKLNLAKPNMFAEHAAEYDFMEIGLSKKMIEMKREMVVKFKEQFRIPEAKKLSTIPNALLMLEDFIKIEKAKEKVKKEEEEEVFEDENDD
jgi:hypothetical protein